MQLTTLETTILRMLRRSVDPLSGRQVADIAGIAPNTANRVLRSLQERSMVESARSGRAVKWSSTTDAHQMHEVSESMQQRVALVVTAVELERTEVLNKLLNTEPVRIGGIRMVRGEIPGSSINWTVYLVRAGMGNATSAALVGLAAGELEADLVAFVGTAAGLKPADNRHLDVVVASRIHNPYVGKQVSGDEGSTLLGRAASYPVSAPLQSMVNACISDSGWNPSPRSQHFSNGHPHAYMAPVVAVEAVQADPDGPVMKTIRQHFQDAAALDMESLGLAAGSDIHGLPFLSFRGLSDFVGDKSAPGNDDLQPQAAGNAAGLLRDVLCFAHPDDFGRGAARARHAAAPSGDPPDDVSDALPGGVQIWMDRLDRISRSRAEAAGKALADMRRSGTTAATWLNRALHRPPVWLREDDSGDGWALVASLASLAGSKVAARGFERAADAAGVAGGDGARDVLLLLAHLDQIESGAVDGGSADLPAGHADWLSAAVEFFRAVVRRDLPDSKARAESVLATLGLVDPAGVLGRPIEQVRVADLEDELRDVVAAMVLRQLATMMLAPGAADQLGVQSGLTARTLRGNPVTRDLADDGLRLAQWASSLRPDSEGSTLTLVQATLGVLVSMSGRASSDVDDEVSRRAMVVEAEALRVRDVLRTWNGESGSSLAAAARARSIQGDFTGAMRLLRPAPDGLASTEEARHPEVVRLGAYLARVTGDDDLALSLALKNPDRVEGQLMRAAVLSNRPQMAGEAKKALFEALEMSDGHHNDFQALMALSRRFGSLDETERSTLTERVQKLALVDPALADVMRARIALAQGDPTRALRLVRGLARNELVLDAHADALVAGGRAEEAARLVFDEGIARGDVPLATEGLQIAIDNGLWESARDISLTLLGHHAGRAVRLKALRSLRLVARTTNQWRDVVTRTEQIMEELVETGLPVPESDHWHLVEAYYFLEKYSKALAVVAAASAISFQERNKALLFLSVLRRAMEEQRTADPPRSGNVTADLGEPRVYALFMRAAADWAEDEQISALAMSTVLMSPGSSLSEVQIADFRDYSEAYFTVHGDSASIRQISVEDDDLGPLIDFLRRDESRQEALGELTGEVRSGRYPLAVLTAAAGRTCTESLIRRDLGFVLAADGDGRLGESAARMGLGGRVVIDTTALVVAPWGGTPLRKLAAHFESVLVPAPLRQDVVDARSSLAMRSTATLGWDPSSKRPVFSETSADQAEAYADAVEQVWADVDDMQVVPVPDATRRDTWLSAVTVAQELGLPVWADDVALRRFARAVDVPAFGTLDLIGVVGDETDVNAAVAAFRENRVVDVPIQEPWSMLAIRSEWNANSASALAISRPLAWADLSAAFSEFQTLIRLRPDDLVPQQTFGWAYAAANGLALATVPSARPQVVAALLAWVVIHADPFFSVVRRDQGLAVGEELPEEAGKLAGLVLAAAEELGNRYFPGADALQTVVDVLCRGLFEAIGPGATSRVIASLVARLDESIRDRVFAAYLRSAGR